MRIDPWGRTVLSRREAMRASALGAGTAAVGSLARPSEAATQPDDRRGSPRRYDMKTSINLWAFPYPDRMSLRECLQLAKAAGFDGIELNYDLFEYFHPFAHYPEAIVYQASDALDRMIGRKA